MVNAWSAMKKLKPKTEYIEIPILNNEYVVIVCFGNASEVMKVLKAWHYPKEELEASCFDTKRGLCFSQTGLHPVIALPAIPKTGEEIGTLSHEAVHAIAHIFDAISENLGGELFAHSVGAVVRETLQAIRPKKQKAC